MAAGWVAPDGSNAHAIGHLTDTVTAEVVRVLAEAGCLVEPTPPAPPMHPADAAMLLCELSCAAKINPPDEEFGQLLAHPAMVKYAWDQARMVGIPAARMRAAHEAHRVLRDHHRGVDTMRS